MFSSVQGLQAVGRPIHATWRAKPESTHGPRTERTKSLAARPSASLALLHSASVQSGGREAAVETAGSDLTQPIAPPAWSTQPAGFSASSALRWRPARQPSSSSYSPCPPTAVRSAFKPVHDVAIYELSTRIAGVLLGVISGSGRSVDGRSRSLARSLTSSSFGLHE